MSQDQTTISESLSSFYDQFIEQLPGIGMGVLIIVLGLLPGSWIGGFARRRLSNQTGDSLMSRFLGKAIKYTLIVIAIMLAQNAAGLGGIAAGILTAAGASAVVLGFAFKDIGENFIAGIIMAFSRPFDVNDTVEIGANFGKVKSWNSAIPNSSPSTVKMFIF
jgi:small-conductance mechanosensitive channel